MHTHMRSSHLRSLTVWPKAIRSSRIPSSRSFTTTQSLFKLTALRRQLYEWLEGPGSVFKYPLPKTTNYLSAYDQRSGRLKRLETHLKGLSSTGDSKPYEAYIGVDNKLGDLPIPKERFSDLKPFPLNDKFVSQKVLSEELREEIWKRVRVEGQDIRTVSASLNIEMNRVGAVVRLMEVQREWERTNKPLARPYNRAVLSMLPQTLNGTDTSSTNQYHESINDLPAHSATSPQIFYPTSESRSFTRRDAGHVFSRDLLPADDRIPHPELIDSEQERLMGLPWEERNKRQQERNKREIKSREDQSRIREQKMKKTLTVVKPTEGGASRWEWRFKDIRTDRAGRDGKAREGIGHRYGVPPQDRKRGDVRIPTSVE